jgi:hypothetical protein
MLLPFDRSAGAGFLHFLTWISQSDNYAPWPGGGKLRIRRTGA